MPSIINLGYFDAPTGVNELEEDCWSDTDDVDPSDIERAADDLMKPHPELDTLPCLLTFDDLITSQRADEFCTAVMSRQSAARGGAFFENTDSLPKQKHPREASIVQIVVPEFLRKRFLMLMHYVILPGHPVENEMYNGLRRHFY